MRSYFIILILFIGLPAASQYDHQQVIDRLEKISIQNDISSPFASVYKQMAVKLGEYADKQDDTAKAFLLRFEYTFANLFFEAREQYLNDNKSIPHWNTFYQNKNLNHLQRMALGMNAHINGDLWKALSQAHPYDSIQKYRKTVLNFQYAFNAIFDSLYTNTRHSARTSFLHTASMGLDKKLMKRAVFRWRKKQVRLALLYYKDSTSMQKQLKRSDRKMKRFDRFVLKWMK